MIKAFKRYYKRQQFCPTLAGAALNPFYISRRGLFVAIQGMSSGINGRTLDLGCGSKPYEHLFEQVDGYVGCDLFLSGHDHAESKIDVFYDGVHLPFDNCSFDSVVSFETLEHIFNPQDILEEIRRVLRPHGKLLLTIPFAWDEHEAPFDFGRYTSFGIQKLLADNRFEVTSIVKTNHYFLALSQLFISYVYQEICPRNLLRFPFQLFFISPLTILALIFSCIFPKRTSYFSNLVVMAVSKEFSNSNA